MGKDVQGAALVMINTSQSESQSERGSRHILSNAQGKLRLSGHGKGKHLCSSLVGFEEQDTHSGHPTASQAAVSEAVVNLHTRRESQSSS